MMIKENILEIAHKLAHIYEDDTPFLMRKGSESFVIGNARKTSVKMYDYTLDFENEYGEINQRKFSDKRITPRRNFTIIDTIFNIFIIFNDINEDGTIAPRPEDELLYVFETQYDTVYTVIKNMVGSLLEVDSVELKNATPDSLIKTLAEIIDNHPETFNEAEIHFQMAHSRTQKQEESSDGEIVYFAKLDAYSQMAQYVGKILKMRPNDILDNWGVAELIVTFGTYRNEESYQNFLEWKSLDMETKKKVKRPEPFAVKFYTNEDLFEEEQEVN